MKSTVNPAALIVDILLEGQGVCAQCQKDLGIASQAGESHGLCKRHTLASYTNEIIPRVKAQYPLEFAKVRQRFAQLQALPDDNFSVDLEKQEQTHADVAQRSEHLPSKQDVAGENPAIRTNLR